MAVRMGLAGFIVPFLFVYRPALLFLGSPVETAWNTLVSAIGVIAMAGVSMGYFGDRNRWYETLPLAVRFLPPETRLDYRSDRPCDRFSHLYLSKEKTRAASVAFVAKTA